VTTYRQFINRDLPPLERGCKTKVPYFSRREAIHQARRSRSADGSLKPYRCHYYEHWHLGHAK
jgi:hypothetical protein